MDDKELKGVGTQRVTCAHCGDPLRRTPSKIRERNYCDISCRDQDKLKVPRKRRSDTGVRKSAWVLKPCATCGKEVERRVSDIRTRTFCSRDCANASHTPKGRTPLPVGTRRYNAGRYVLVRTERGWEEEHRVVMATHIGRPLLDHENVHHVNGVRDDNRLANLELWVVSQPKGQRAADLLTWARAILAEYEPIEDKIT